MFSLGRRKKIVNLQRYLRRIVDRTAPNNGVSMDVARTENRYNRIIPTLLSPWTDGRVDVGRSLLALTKDIADHGIGVITNHPFPRGDVVVGFWLPDRDMQSPWFFQGSIQRESPIGGGFWLLGIELEEFISDDRQHELEPLAPLAKKLLPPQGVCS